MVLVIFGPYLLYLKEDLKLVLNKSLSEIDYYIKSKKTKSFLTNVEIKNLLSIQKSLEFFKETLITSFSKDFKTLEYEQKIQEFRKKQDQELLKRIEDRKNGLLIENEKTQSNIDPIIIEAYLEDFDSERSRFVLSVITANNIYLSFYNGIIKLLNEDDSFDEVYFSSKDNILKFTNEKYSKDILIDTTSNEKISDILSNQTNSKIYSDLILNCLSILHYINTFYTKY